MRSRWIYRTAIVGVAIPLVASSSSFAVMKAYDRWGATHVSQQGSERRTPASVARPNVLGGDTALGFRISGNVTGFFPGSERTLHLTLTNLLAAHLVVTSVTTTVIAESAGCPASFVTVGMFVGQVGIAPHAKAQVSVHATMSHAASNECQGALFKFRYAGLGRAS